MSTAATIEPGHYYELRTGVFFFPALDAENYEETKLVAGDFVLCANLIHRAGGNGRGRYARLLHLKADGTQRVLFLRVSNLGRPPANWREVNPMKVLALADKLPTL